MVAQVAPAVADVSGSAAEPDPAEPEEAAVPDAGEEASLPEPVAQLNHAVEEKDADLKLSVPPNPLMSSINFVRISQTANPLSDHVFELNGEQFRYSTVVDASGSEEHLNKSSRDMVTLRRASMCHGEVPDVGETCPSILLAMDRVREDEINCCILLETFDPFVWLPALSDAWRQPGAGEDHASTPSRVWVKRYVLLTHTSLRTTSLSSPTARRLCNYACCARVLVWAHNSVSTSDHTTKPKNGHAKGRMRCG